ncbi:hypothetical protein A6770_14945 [Nostoc minutum NIES-26]|uniref:Uncharacterized protein n=1 Tax=Nostoc minutum NIES-26 TaxID=1844469 RepID=A0A367RM36_9NOSO|nr:hypothetical protein A6770_14945 [Nostoc minutum NIES-26]
MFAITLGGVKLTGDDIDFVSPEDEDGNETDDFINAYGYRVTLMDSGWDKAGAAEIYVTREELDGTTYELLLEIIQPI